MLSRASDQTGETTTMATKHIHHHDEDVMSFLTRVIGAIDVVKNLVPIQLGQGVLSTTSAFLVVVKVSFLTLFAHKSRKHYATCAQDTIKNKEDFRNLIDQCDWMRQLIERSNWGSRQSEGRMSTMLSDAVTELNV